MSIDELLTRLRKADVILDLDGDELCVSAPRGALDNELRDLLTSNKSAIVDALRLARRATTLIAPPIERMQPGQDYPTSFAQERLWFLDQLEPGNAFYNMPLSIRLQGELLVPALSLSLNTIVDRHQSLRTRFVAINGTPKQLIDDISRFALVQQDLSVVPVETRDRELLDRVRHEALRPFDLAQDCLVRAILLRLDEYDHVLLFTTHHIISDGWSMGVLFRELGSCYAAFSSGHQPEMSDLPIQYTDFANWQRGWLSGDVLEAQLAYWRQHLEGVTALDLPTDRPRPPVQTFNGAGVRFDLSKKLVGDLDKLSRQHGVSLFMTFLTAFSVLLNRYSGQQDIVIGSPIANRNRAELEGLIGFFVNSLVMRIDVSGDPHFTELLQRVQGAALGAYEHQDLPFEKLVDEIRLERDLARNPLFQVMFALQNTPKEPLQLEGLTLDMSAGDFQTCRFDMEVHVCQWDGSDEIILIYNTDLFDEATIERMLLHYQSLLETMVATPQMRIADAPMLGDPERRQLIDNWNQTTTDYPREQTVQALFEAQAAATPDAVALDFASQQLSYGELNERANRLAHYLRRHGVGAEVKVGLFVERSLEMVIAVLGILKAGGAYLPLDLDYPASRIAFMLEDAEAPVLVSSSKLTARLPEGGYAQVCVDSDWAQIEQESADNPEITTTADSLAYVIYTSGSTGIPKGVEICHRAINRLVRNTDYYQVDATDRIAQASSISFDAATFELWGALQNGAQLVGVSKDILLNSNALAALLQEKGVTAMFITTAVFNQIAREVPQAFKGLKGLMFGGEAVDPDAVRRVLADQPPERLLHVYGPTESTTFATWYRIESLADDATTVPIGRPLANTTLYLLDANRKPVPIGVSGELYIGGDGLARGYLNRPELTAERFVPNPFEAGGKLYRTGDKVRFRADGTIEFQGRFDHQIKLRGFRIELGEIETALIKHAAVQDAVAMVREDEPGDKRIAAYLVASPQWVEQISSSQSGEHVDDWQALYEETYGNVDESQDLTTNFTGWNSSYTGEPIPLVEMEEWQASTVTRIAALQPHRVLEIGCGTGLLLLQLAERCARYVGTDFSAVAQRQLHEVISTRDEYKHIELWQRTADDFSDVEPGDFDTVIINSVTQYLPSMDYLAEVVEGAVKAIADGGRLMLGDIRSLALLKAYHTSVQLYLSPHAAGGAELLRNIQQHVEEENELVIEPAFFHALKQRIERISHVEILLKQGQYHNELSGYRYDVILHVEAQAEALPKNGQWLDWGAENLDLDQLKSRLRATDQEWLGVNAMPNARVYRDVTVLEQLQGEGSVLSVGELKQAAESDPQQTLDPHDLWQLAQAVGYQLELSYSGAGTDGRMDALFRRSRREDCAGAVFWPQRQDVPERAWSAYGTNPLKGRLGNELIPLLRQDLQQQLPDYMLPSVYVLLDALPLNPNGKVERKALPVPGDVRASLGAEYTAPRTAMEQRLAAIWAEVLKLERVGIHDNFFDLGGHSLMATQVVSRIRAQLNVELPLSEMFGYPTVAELAPVTQTLLGDSDGAQAEVIPLADRSQPLPLSFAQERLWFLDQLEPGSAAYNQALSIRLKGELRLDAFADSLNAIVSRQQVLRTHFDLHQGIPMQIIDETGIEIVQDDLSALAPAEQRREVKTRASHEAAQPFDLSTGPLLRCSLLRLSNREHVLLLTLHHIVSDGWSLGVLFRELENCYAAFCKGEQAVLPELPIQYVDFAQWQRAFLSGEQLQQQQQAYWQQRLEDLPTLNLPTDRPRPALQTHKGEQESLRLDAGLTEQLAQLSKQSGVTLFMTLLAAFAVLMQRYSGQDDVVVGTPIANRNRSEVEPLIGFFINMLVLRLDMAGDPQFMALLEQVRQTALGAYQHQDVPFEKLVEVLQPTRDLSRNPLFQVQFALQNAPLEAPELEGLVLERIDTDEHRTRFDLTCHVWERGENLQVVFVYNTDLFEASTITRMMAHYTNLLAQIVAAPQARLSCLPMLAQSESHQLLEEWNQTTADYPRDKTFNELFEAQAVASPDALAVVFGDQRLSYGELNQRANCLAHYLRARGVGPDLLVGICVERSLEMIVGILGILKSGGAYVPLDPDNPRPRLEFQIDDSKLSLVLTQQALFTHLPEIDGEVICLDSDWALVSEQSTHNPELQGTAENLAYVIYTSGSTGQPKGVLVEHRSIMNFAEALQQAVYTDHKPEAYSVSFNSPISFDNSMKQLVMLLYGHSLNIIPQSVRLDPQQLASYLRDNRVDVLNCVPAQLKQLLDEDLFDHPDWVPSIVLSGGEAIDGATWSRLCELDRTRFYNTYGPTESTVDSTCCRIGKPLNTPVIGRPIINTRTLILDPSLQPVPIGVAGELHIGGAGLARGYLNRPALTAEKFITDPYSDPGARLYKTGDLVRYRADGNIEFIGRIDHQVKLRGFRIELGEIESLLTDHAAVQDAIVVVRESGDQDQRLVAYVIANDSAESLVLELRKYLPTRLPNYMVPSTIMLLDQFPLTANGKLDRSSLPEPGIIRAGLGADYVASRNEIEEQLVQIWQKIMKLENVGVHDNFFDLGGHSLLLTQVVSQMRVTMGLELSLSEMFRYPTVAELANKIELIRWTSGEISEDESADDEVFTL